MSGFDLVLVDGGDPIHLPPGETVLGRGPLLGVSDKRVSRHHGLLENLDGQLRLKPTHLNPCFVQSSLADEPRPLQKDCWYPLHHGDLFSLLPGQFIFRVVAVGGADRTPRNSQMFEEEDDELPVFSKPDVEAAPVVGQDHGPSPQGEQTLAAVLNEEKADSNKGESAQPKEVDDDNIDVAPPVPRRRVLPAWMMSAAGASKNPSPSLKVQSSVKRSKTPAAASTSSKRAATKQTPEPSEEEEEEARPRKKRRRKISTDEAAQCEADVHSEEPRVQHQSGPSRSEVSDESDNITMDVEEEGEGNATAQTSGISESDKDDKKSKMTKPEPAASVGSNRGFVSSPAPSRPRLRTPCPYGNDCYRKNPIHFQECSHPGDTDYEEEDEEAEDTDRPECPYGTDCYRKNPLHRKEFKHTKKPARTTRTAPKKVTADDNDDDEDEDDYDNSFINDDSEDMGNDSDYVPLDSDDSDREDVRRLQKEAKQFLKRRN